MTGLLKRSSLVSVLLEFFISAVYEILVSYFKIFHTFESSYHLRSLLNFKIFNKWTFAVLEQRTRVSILQVNEIVHVREMSFHSTFVVQIFVCICKQIDTCVMRGLKRQHHTKQEQ